MAEKRRFLFHALVPSLAVMLLLIWACVAEVDEAVMGDGKVVPSSQNKILQHAEGGIIAEILVREGDTVKVGDPIYRLRQEFFEADVREKELEIYAMQARELRMQALIDGQAPVFGKTLYKEIPSIIDNEVNLYKAEARKHEEQDLISKQKISQREIELQEYHSKLRNLEIELDVARESLQIAQQLMDKNAGSRKEVLTEMARKQSLVTQIDSVRSQIPLAKEKLQEARLELSQSKSERDAELYEQLKEVKLKISQMQEKSGASSERASRLTVASPVKGFVNKLMFHTRGGAIKAGDKLAEITPIDDTLTIEAKINVADRARVFPGQEARLNISAYDFATFGALEGEVTQISADTFADRNGMEYYQVRLKATSDGFGDDRPVLPGMAVQVHILAGKRSVMRYLLKPLIRAQQHAMIEK